MRISKRIFFFLALPLIVFLFWGSLYIPISRKKLSPYPVISFQVVDRNNVLLREVLSDEGGRCRWVRLEEISPYLIRATLASEDSQFFFHSGISPFSVARALYQNLKHKRIISGASTITQQLVRNIFRFRRNIFSKAAEAWLAMRLEHTLSKPEILVQYLNRISYGNQAYGIESASRLYFDKPASHLSLAEATFLAAIPRSPSVLNPYRNFGPVQRRQRRIINAMRELGLIQKDEAERAEKETLLLRSEKEKFRAPHFCDFILGQLPFEQKRNLRTIQTTLDYNLQEKVEILLKGHLGVLEKKRITNGAVIVLDNRTGEILSLVGSRDFFDDRHAGQVNGALSLRQPGSTLKPITYALALEKGMTAATILEDQPTHFTAVDGSFMPENYDEKYHGPIRLRSALACSYNIPAVAAVQIIGPDFLYRRLKELEFESLQKDPNFYGLGLTLGNGEVMLLELVRAYAAFAREGIFLEEKSIITRIQKDNTRILSNEKRERRRVFSPEVAYVITHILADQDARIPSFGYNSPLRIPFPVAVKTGTSKDFRDNWTVGYTSEYTVGVWAGNFDGCPMHNVSGITGCGPLFKDIMLLLAKREKPGPFREPKNMTHVAICPLSGKLPGPNCPGVMEEIFIRGTEPKTICLLSHESRDFTATNRSFLTLPSTIEKFEITFPQEGDIFKMDPVLRTKFQTLKFKISVPKVRETRCVEWWVNGRRIGIAKYPFYWQWNLEPGYHTIKARALQKENIVESRPVRITVLS